MIVRELAIIGTHVIEMRLVTERAHVIGAKRVINQRHVTEIRHVTERAAVIGAERVPEARHVPDLLLVIQVTHVTNQNLTLVIVRLKRNGVHMTFPGV